MNEIGGDARLALHQLSFVRVELTLCFQHRQEIDQTRPVLLGGKIDRQLALLDGSVQPVATFLLLRITDQGVLDLFEGVENGRLVADQRLLLARGLHCDVGTNASPGE